MALLNLLFFALSAIALVFQLITPVILNLPAMAVVLIAFALAVYYFRRRRQKSRLPLIAGLSLVFHSLFLLLSIAIFFVITLPNESPEDSPAAIQGIRNILISNGIIAKPKTTPPPIMPQRSGDSAAQVNAPDPSAVQITVEDAEKPGTAESETRKP